MSTYPTQYTPIKSIGLREVCQVNDRHFKRLKGTQAWTEYTPRPETNPATDNDDDNPLYLSLIHESQPPDEPIHWSLFVARENHPGLVYQVRGDAESMTYEPSRGVVDITTSECFSTLYQLGTLTEEQGLVAKEVADDEPPPRAVNRRAVTENCQGWSVRVIKKLVDRGIVSMAKLEMARGMMEPI